jgi:hypothetical protein
MAAMWKHAAIEKFGSANLTAFRSLAKSRRVPLATVLAAAEDGTLRRVVEMRDYGAADRIAERNHAQIMSLLRKRELGAKIR